MSNLKFNLLLFRSNQGIMFDRSRIGLTSASSRSSSLSSKRQKYREDDNLSDDVSDETRGSSSIRSRIGDPVTDLSQVLRKSRGQSSEGTLKSRQSIVSKPVSGIKSRLGASQSQSEVKNRVGVKSSSSSSDMKSRLGVSTLSLERKRKLDVSDADGISTKTLAAKRSLVSMTSHLKQNILKTVQERNDNGTSGYSYCLSSLLLDFT